MASLKNGGKEELAELFVRAMRLADRRNTIAHNPVMVQVFQDLKTSEYSTELAINSDDNELYIDMEVLDTTLRECELLAGDIQRAMNWGAT